MPPLLSSLPSFSDSVLAYPLHDLFAPPFSAFETVPKTLRGLMQQPCLAFWSLSLTPLNQAVLTDNGASLLLSAGTPRLPSSSFATREHLPSATRTSSAYVSGSS